MADMSERHDDNDAENIFWPGYVDATTNLALNLLFLLTVMITAVFMFALEMGRTSLDQAAKPEEQQGTVVAEKKSDPTEQIVMLKLEIQRLNKMLARQNSLEVLPGGLEKSIEATQSEANAPVSVQKVSVKDFEIIVHFKDEAISLNPEERKELAESLQPVVAHGKSDIYVEIPGGFSEARRLGFYRAMAVRNLLIEMDVPKEKINVSVVDGNGDANASLVMVR